MKRIFDKFRQWFATRPGERPAYADAFERAAFDHQHEPEQDDFEPSFGDTEMPLADGDVSVKVDELNQPIAGQTNGVQNGEKKPAATEQPKENVVQFDQERFNRLEQERNQYAQQLQQAYAVLQQQYAQQQPVPTPQPQAPQRWSDQLPEHVRATLDPQAKAVMDMLGDNVNQALKPQQEYIQKLEQKLSQFEQQYTQTQEQQRWQSANQEWESIVAEHGPQVRQYEGQIVQGVRNGYSPKQVFNIVASDYIAQQKANALAEQKFNEMMKTAKGAGQLYGGGAPSAQPVSRWQPGEPFEVTAARHMGNRG